MFPFASVLVAFTGTGCDAVLVTKTLVICAATAEPDPVASTIATTSASIPPAPSAYFFNPPSRISPPLIRVARH
jgi:hypothetical protein